MMPLRPSTLALAALCVALPLTAQDNSMPGMQMPAAPTPTAKPPAKKPRPNLTLPGDAGHPTPTDAPADAETRSLQNSEQQQRAQPATAGPASDTQSLTHDTLTLQEAENPALHTGENLPAPDLLNDVAARPPITLPQLEAFADQANPSLAEADALIRRSLGQARQAGLPPNPSIGYSGEHIRGGEYGGGEQGAFVSQTVVLGGKLGLRRDIYRQQSATDRISLEAQHLRVRNELDQAFYRALTAQAAVVLRQRLLQLTLDAVTTVHQLANVGQADAPDILQAEVEVEQAKIDSVDAQRTFLANFSVVAALAGKPNLPPSPLTGALEQPPDLHPEDPNGQVAQLIAASPTVRRAQQEVTLAEARLRDARREPIPDLKLQAGEWYSGEQIESSHYPAGWMGFATASVDLPLWNRNQGNIDAATADLDRARHAVLRSQLSLKQRAEPLAQQYLAARFEAERYRTQLLPRAQRAYELYLMKYQQMASAYPQVLVSQRTLFQLQIAYLTALNTEWSTAISLQNATLTGGLDTPDAAGTADTMLNLPQGGGQ